MISLITQKLDIHSLLGSEDKSEVFDFIKYSPDISHSKKSKIILIAFRKNSAAPAFVIKTVRSADQNLLIDNAHEHLQRWANLVQRTDFSSQFPKPLAIKRIDSISYSIETALFGKRISEEEACALVPQFFPLYKALAIDNNKHSLKNLAENLIHSLPLSNTDIKFVEQTLENKSSLLSLREIPQHGDLTVDNLLEHDGKLLALDCEYANQIKISGFDLYHLLIRFPRTDFFAKKWNTLFTEYFSLTEEDVRLTKNHLLVYALCEAWLKKDYIFTKSFSLKYNLETLYTFLDL